MKTPIGWLKHWVSPEEFVVGWLMEFGGGPVSAKACIDSVWYMSNKTPAWDEINRHYPGCFRSFKNNRGFHLQITEEGIALLNR